jgi:carbonic anhydrase
LDLDNNYFNNLADIQKPEFLWIGCSDSRVPANEITNTESGEIFVHRNIANLLVNNDLNMLSVLKYAVEVLMVKHIIVCGHYGCGGVKAAATNHHYGMLNKWLRNIKDVYRLHIDELSKIMDEEEKINALVEFNIIEQVTNLSKISIIQKAWKNGEFPILHGCVYGLKSGILKDLVNLDKNSPMDSIYKFDFEDSLED